MGWGSGIVDGREVGYMVDGTCEQEGCDAEIDRGLSYACGDWHGETEYACAGYFCGKHLNIGIPVADSSGGREWTQLCAKCLADAHCQHCDGEGYINDGEDECSYCEGHGAIAGVDWEDVKARRKRRCGVTDFVCQNHGSLDPVMTPDGPECPRCVAGEFCAVCNAAASTPAPDGLGFICDSCGMGEL
jgi:hypothetical protein